MKFNIKRVEIQNFRSIQDQVALDVNEGIYSVVGENLDEKNSTNGCGKSSIVSAIYWCLTGNALTNEVLADEVINISKGKNCRVTIYIDSDQGEIKILRTRKDSEFNNNLFLFINDQDLSSHKIADTQETINKLFKIPFDLLRSTIIMTSDMSSAFSELTPQQRVQTLESIRDYAVWDKVRDKANCDIKAYNKEINEFSSEIDQLTGSYKTYENLVTIKQNELVIARAEIDSSKFESELNSFDLLIDSYIPKSNEAKAKLQEAQQIQLEDLSFERNQLASLNEEYNNKKSELNDKYNREYNDLNASNQAEINKAKDEITDIKSKISSAEYEIRDLNRQKSELDKWFNNPNCPLCGKPLTRTEEEINDKKNSLLEIENKIISINADKTRNDLALNSYTTIIEELKNGLQEKLKRLEDKNLLEVDTLKKQYTDKTKEINDFLAKKESEQRQSKVKIQELMTEVNKIEQEIERVKQQKAGFEQKHQLKLQNLEKLNSEILKYKEEIDKIVIRGKELRKNITELENKRQLSDYYYKLLGNKGELRPYLLSKSISFVNLHVQRYMSYFFKNTTAQLYLNGANIDILIDSNGIKKSISSLSSGEAKRVNISIQLALYDLIQSTSQISFNLLFLDEIENSMDATGVQQLLNIVEDKADEGISSLFWITNNPDVMQHFNSKIICRKAMGKTSIVLEGVGI